MSRLKEKVREQLAGQEIRNAMRQAGRRTASQLKLIYNARRQHKLDTLEQASDWLLLAGIHQSDETYYGVTMLYAGGATLVYSPDGKLSSRYAPRISGDEPEQWVLFSDECPEISSS
jgi:hypothetical protein